MSLDIPVSSLCAVGATSRNSRVAAKDREASRSPSLVSDVRQCTETNICAYRSNQRMQNISIRKSAQGSNFWPYQTFSRSGCRSQRKSATKQLPGCSVLREKVVHDYGGILYAIIWRSADATGTVAFRVLCKAAVSFATSDRFCKCVSFVSLDSSDVKRSLASSEVHSRSDNAGEEYPVLPRRMLAS